ncbi:MAG: Ldh family oxidoreductase [Planctomycetota bacterium]|jgi:LDH2 family malate/lactate/ureidoglycolate dehydrogenase
MPRVPYDGLADFCSAVFAARGLSADDARYVGEIVTLTEAFGVTTHGVKVVLAVAGQVGGRIAPAAKPKVVAETAGTATIDAQGVLGQLAMRRAKELAVAKARDCGVAMVGVRSTSWIGAVGPFLIDLAQAGMLAMATAQSSACLDCAPVGGIDATFSTNPIALAFPTGSDPVVADFSTAAYSMGRIGQLIRAGQRAPEPIFLDQAGELTDDPNVVHAGGSVLFTGGRNFGHKGYALSLWCEALTALSGGSANNPDVPQTQSFALTVIDPAAFAGSDHFLAEMKRFCARVKSSRPRPGADPVRLPGEGGFTALREAKSRGVPLDEDTIAKLNETARANNVQLTL